MRTTLVLVACALVVSCGVVAVAAYSRPATEAAAPGLGEIMTRAQTRHVKLWLSGSNDNWALARYELDDLRQRIDDAATFHPTHKGVAIPKLIDAMMKGPLDQLDAAVKAQSHDSFVKAFDALTQGCNRCHEAARFGFNVVTRPVGNPYANEAFRPVR